MRSLKESLHAVIDLTGVLMIVMVFVGLMVGAYIIWTLVDQLGATGSAAKSIGNITVGFDNAVGLILIAITIFILAIAIGALYYIRVKK